MFNTVSPLMNALGGSANPYNLSDKKVAKDILEFQEFLEN